MKKHLATVLIVFTSHFVMAGNPNNGGISARTAAINVLDTVYFDLSKGVINGDNVNFPVYISSDDTVNSLDFSFKYNHANLVYDSIINLTLHLHPTAYYNTIDSTVRFTSYNMDNYKMNTPIVAIDFTTIIREIRSSDLNTVKALLNGDPCSVKIIDALPLGVQKITNKGTVNVYPNPASELINIEFPEKVNAELYDIDGRQCILQACVNNAQNSQLNIRNVSNGVYLLKIYNNDLIAFKKIIINNP